MDNDKEYKIDKAELSVRELIINGANELYNKNNLALDTVALGPLLGGVVYSVKIIGDLDSNKELINTVKKSGLSVVERGAGLASNATGAINNAFSLAERYRGYKNNKNGINDDKRNNCCCWGKPSSLDNAKSNKTKYASGKGDGKDNLNPSKDRTGKKPKGAHKKNKTKNANNAIQTIEQIQLEEATLKNQSQDYAGNYVSTTLGESSKSKRSKATREDKGSKNRWSKIKNINIADKFANASYKVRANTHVATRDLKNKWNENNIGGKLKKGGTIGFVAGATGLVTTLATTTDVLAADLDSLTATVNSTNKILGVDLEAIGGNLVNSAVGFFANLTGMSEDQMSAVVSTMLPIIMTLGPVILPLIPPVLSLVAGFIALAWPVLLVIGALYALTAIFNWAKGESVSATGILFGALAVVGAILYNVVALIWNGITTVYDCFNNFGQMLTITKDLMKLGFLNILESITSVIDKYIGTNYSAGINEQIEQTENHIKSLASTVEVTKKMELKDVGDAWNSGYNKGDEVGNKVSEKAGGAVDKVKGMAGGKGTESATSATTSTQNMNTAYEPQGYGNQAYGSNSYTSISGQGVVTDNDPVSIRKEDLDYLTTKQKETYANSNNTTSNQYTFHQVINNEMDLQKVMDTIGALVGIDLTNSPNTVVV